MLLYNNVAELRQDWGVNAQFRVMHRYPHFIQSRLRAGIRNAYPMISLTSGATLRPYSSMQRIILACDKGPAEYFMSKR